MLKLQMRVLSDILQAVRKLRSELMSDSAALEFTVDNQISRTFRSVDLSQLVIQTVIFSLYYQLRKIYGSKRPGYLIV